MKEVVKAAQDGSKNLRGIPVAYQDGEFEWTEIMSCMNDPDTWVVHIAPVMA